MSDLEHALDAIGLIELVEIFRQKGFETWPQLLDIQEEDLVQLDIKVGHRRRLQRAIQDAQHMSNLQPLERQTTSQSDENHDAQTQHRISTSRADGVHEQPQPAPKRKYRRHPEPDANAPERPPSAYVLFSVVRERLKDESLSFTAIAKLVGEQWRDPVPEERAACEQEAQERKECFYAELAEYKQTAKFAEYQEYLAEFKAKHAEKNALAQKKARAGNSSQADDDMVDGDSMRYSAASSPSATAAHHSPSAHHPSAHQRSPHSNSVLPQAGNYDPALMSNLISPPSSSRSSVSHHATNEYFTQSSFRGGQHSMQHLNAPSTHTTYATPGDPRQNRALSLQSPAWQSPQHQTTAPVPPPILPGMSFGHFPPNNQLPPLAGLLRPEPRTPSFTPQSSHSSGQSGRSSDPRDFVILPPIRPRRDSNDKGNSTHWPPRSHNQPR